MATVPISGTNIRLLSGIPFSNDYKHSRWHTSLDAQIAYFNNVAAIEVVYSIAQANFQRQNGQTFIRIDKSIDEIFNVNYLRFQNGSYDPKWFYAFVTKLEYVQRNTTYVHFEIDVIQTYMFDFTFKPSFVIREHCKLWNSDGSPVINTIDEGLNYGTEYDVVGANQFQPNNGVLFLVIVAKSTLHVFDGHPSNNFIKASMNGTVQPLSIYFHPFDIFGNTPNIVIDGVEHELDLINNILTAIYTNPNAVNSVVSLYITDNVGFKFTYDDSNNPAKLISDDAFFQTIEIADITNNGTLPPPAPTNTVYVREALTYYSSTIECKPKYQDFQTVTESKLLMHPYAFNVLDDFKGNRLIIKNEHVDGDMLNVEVMGSLGVSNKVAYIPKDYLMDNINPEDQRLISIENGMIDNSPHDVSIITDMLAAFLQGNRNSLINQANSLLFNGAVDAIGSVVSGVASGISGNGVGIASAGVGLVKGAGNTVLQLQGMLAKQKDINNTPPSLSKMGSNTSFDYGNGYSGFWVISKQIKPEYRKKLTDFFKTYGYKVNEVKIPNFYTRQSFNYIQTNTCNITGNFNNEDLQDIKSVFDNGITLWHTHDIGNYDLPNPVVATVDPDPDPDPDPDEGTLFTGKSFGKNNMGQLGLGFRTTLDPQVVASPQISLDGLTDGFLDVSFGFGIMVAVDNQGRVWSCGSGSLGIDGIHGVVEMSTFTGFKKVACCVQGSGNLMLKEDGTVWYVGFGSDGERAGATATSNVATQIPGLTNIVDIQMGSFNCFAIKSNGDLYAWGENSFGGVGNGSTSGASVSVPTVILSDVKEFATGNDHMLALKTNGDLYAWGNNRYGACALPYNDAEWNIFTPTLTATNVTTIAAGFWHSLYIANDGKVYSSGNPVHGATATGVATIPVLERDEAEQDRYYHWIENQFPTDLDGIACSDYNSFGWRGNTVYACGLIGSGNCLGDGRSSTDLDPDIQIPLINYITSSPIARVESTGGSGPVMILSVKP